METKTETTKQGLLKKMTDEALATLCESLERGKSEELVQYLNVMSRFPRYSFRNVMLIQIQKPEATRVMGYQSWRQLGRYVRKDEKAIRIWAPMLIHGRGEGRKRRQGDAAVQACVRL